MSSRGSTTAATPASSSPIRYEAQPRSSCVTCRNSTLATLSGSGGSLGQRLAGARVEEVHLADVHPQPRGGVCLDVAGRLQTRDRLVAVAGARQVRRAGVGRQRSEEHTSELQSRYVIS